MEKQQFLQFLPKVWDRDVLLIFPDFLKNRKEKTVYLPKYDSHGYPYRYLTREYMEGASAQHYKVVYGKLDMSTGEFNDVLPAWEVRDKNDNSIYDRGTVSNVLQALHLYLLKKYGMPWLFRVSYMM